MIAAAFSGEIVARAFPEKYEPEGICAEVYRCLRIIKVCYAAYFNFCHEVRPGSRICCRAYILLYYGKVLQGFPDLLFRIFIVLEFSAMIICIGGHVKIPVAAEIEEYRLLLALFLCLHRFVYRPLDRMRAFRGRDDAFCFCEFYRSLEYPVWP